MKTLPTFVCLQNRSVFSCFSAQLQPTDPLEGTSTLQKKAVSQSFLPKQTSCSRELPYSLMTSHTHVTVLVTGKEGILLPWLGTSLYQISIWRADVLHSPQGNSSLRVSTNYTELMRKTWRTDIWNGPQLPSESSTLLTHICIPSTCFSQHYFLTQPQHFFLQFCHVSQSFRDLLLCKFRFSKDAMGSEIKHSSGQCWRQNLKVVTKI